MFGINHASVLHATANVRAFDGDFRYIRPQKRFESILSEIRGHVDQMPEAIDMDQLYLPQLREK